MPATVTNRGTTFQVPVMTDLPEGTDINEKPCEKLLIVGDTGTAGFLYLSGNSLRFRTIAIDGVKQETVIDNEVIADVSS